MSPIRAWLLEHTSDLLIALIVGVLFAGGAVWWWRPLVSWWWSRRAMRLPHYLASRAERYAFASKIIDIDDRVRTRNELCRTMGEFLNRDGVSRRTMAHSGHEGLVVALAGAVAAAPKKGDHRLILVTSNRHLPGNAQHKIIVALDVVASRPGLIPQADYDAIKTWIDGIAEKELSLPSKIRALKGKLQ